MKEKIKPIEIEDKESGKKYVLEFSRKSIEFAEAHGFVFDEVLTKPVTRIPELFYYAFIKNHKCITKKQTDEMFDRLGGLPNGMLERLGDLYAEPYSCLVQDEEAEQDEKNSTLTVNF